MSWADRTANEVAESARLADRVRAGVRRFRKALRKESADCATEALFNWSARGVEWYGGRRGWVFLHDPVDRILHSVPGAAARTSVRHREIPDHSQDSIIAHVWRTGEEYISNDVLRDEREHKPYLCLDERTRSELAVPIVHHGPGGEEVLGVYNIEADAEGAFTRIQARELRRNAAMLAYPMLVLRSPRAADGPRRNRRTAEPHWGWHPEVHGWNPGRILSRFCHTVARNLTRREAAAPSCAIWYRDPETGRCWALAACGYDYDFLKLYALDKDSAVARVAAEGGRIIHAGTPETSGFEAMKKARQNGVERVLLASLRADVGDGGTLSGALAIYSFDEETVLPGIETTRWLVRQAEGLLARVYRLRAPLANAYIINRLGKTALVNPGFRLFRRALSAVLYADATSIYTRGVRGNKLIRMDMAGFESGRNKEADTFTIRDGGRQDSITAHCAVHHSRAWRINFGDQDPIYQSENPPPKAHRASFEPLEVHDAQHHRRFGIGVPAAPESGDHAVGVIRMFRSGQSPPFTHLDGRLIERVAASYHSCQFLFAHWRFTGKEQEVGPFVVSPTPALLVAVLRRAVDRFRSRGRAVRQGAVFEFCEDARPAYRRFAYYSPKHQLPPDERLAPLAEDLPGKAVWDRHTITVMPMEWSDGQAGERVCVPVMTWSGRYLVQTVCCLDFDGRLPWNAPERDDVLRLWVESTAMLAVNRWQDPPLAVDDQDEPLISAFVRYVSTQVAGVEDARLLPAHVAEPPEVHNWPPAAERSLATYGVRVRPDGARCAIPLAVGTFRVAVLVCDLSQKLARLLRQAALRPSATDHLQLSTLVGLVAGAWCRVVAPKSAAWRVVLTLDAACDPEGMRGWHATVTGPGAEELASGRADPPARSDRAAREPAELPYEFGGEG